jgi:hypothetical protein
MTTPTHADHRRAEEALAARETMCSARGCPRAWTDNVGLGASRLCSRHAGREPREWPAITEQLLYEDAERARELAAQAPHGPGMLANYPVQPSDEQLAAVRACAEQLRSQVDEGPGALLRRRWLELRERERAGEVLSSYQAQAWRTALKLAPDAPADAWAWFEQPQEMAP